MSKPRSPLPRRRRPLDEPGILADINTTPLIDVMLVLLVMLIITIPIQLHAVNLELPVGRPPTDAPKPDKVQIDIDGDSRLYWQGLEVTPTELQDKMLEISKLPQAPDLHLRPHKDARYQVVAHVLATTKRLGLSKIAVIGSEQFVKP